MAALICYPPFVLMGDGGPLDYHPGTRGEDGWALWFAGHPVLLAVIGAVLVALTGDLCLGDGDVRHPLLQPDASRHPDQRAVCVQRATRPICRRTCSG